MCGNSLDGLYFIIISDRYVLLTVFRYLKLYKPESLPSSSELEASSSRSLWFFRILVAARSSRATASPCGSHDAPARRPPEMARPRCRCCARAHGAAAKRSHPSHTPSALLFALFPYTPPLTLLPFPPLLFSLFCLKRSERIYYKTHTTQPITNTTRGGRRARHPKTTLPHRPPCLRMYL
jgi:hypothetical protein